jgi:phosphoribosylaminoimidazolecarboxamide formyltransferase/IMP cyclohydrolase
MRRVQLIGEFRRSVGRRIGLCHHQAYQSLWRRHPAGLKEAWDSALAGDPESAFGGVLACNVAVDKATATAINEIFFEVLIAPAFDADALEILRSKKNRILLVQKKAVAPATQYRSLLSGVLHQQADEGNYCRMEGGWRPAGHRCGETGSDLCQSRLQTSEIKRHRPGQEPAADRQGLRADESYRLGAAGYCQSGPVQFRTERCGVGQRCLFPPFPTVYRSRMRPGLGRLYSPGGSIRDKDSIDYCVENNLAMVITGMRHFKH